MNAASHLILIGSALILLSVLAGLVSARIGAPFLLVFLGFGMLAGEDGPGGLIFNDFQIVYLIGNIALAIVLFDAGLRTSRTTLRLALAPAGVLATVGVFLTAAILGAAAAPILDIPLTEGLLMGAIVGSTDAAAVLFLLNRQGQSVERRVGATLEVESGFNDPAAIFLTSFLVGLLSLDSGFTWWTGLRMFVLQMAGGAVIGFLGGLALRWLINKLVIASGLYPILAATGGVLVFALGQSANASGFLAVYLAGIVFGAGRHRAQRPIERFHDALSWLSQISLFLMLGLLVTPSRLMPDLLPALAVALVLIFVARPLAVWLCLLPFRYSMAERVFIAWVGLRGAVPIFLATIPLVAGLENSAVFFNVTFVVVIASLLLQGWTLEPIARGLGLLLPAASPSAAEQLDLGGPSGGDRDLLAYRVGKRSPALSWPFASLPLPFRARVLAVLRDNVVLRRDTLERLAEGDTVIVLVPPQHSLVLDRLFAPVPEGGRETLSLGDFILDAEAPLADVIRLYDLPLDPPSDGITLGAFVRRNLRRSPVIGDRVAVGNVDFTVAAVEDSRIGKVGLALVRRRPPLTGIPILLRRRLARLRRRLRRRSRR